MARVVLHAGMGKTGSTSIQQYLRVEEDRLRSDAGITTLTAFVDAPGKVRLEPPRGRGTNSSALMVHLLDHPAHRAALLDSFFGQLADAADRHDAVVVTGEAFGRALALQDEDLLERLDALARGHEVRIAYYVRPQHLALESARKHWRSDRERIPSQFLARYSRLLHHLDTMRFVADGAPDIDFTPRPCRRDLLPAGSVVADFAQVFLGVDANVELGTFWENRGLPLDVANTLASLAADGWWPSPQDQAVLDVTKRLLGQTECEPSPEVVLSRLVLQQACHERFEAGNLAMIETLGWNTTEWVPPVDGEVGEASFERLDELWRSKATPAELTLLGAALSSLVDAEERERDTVALRRELAGLRSRRSVRAGERLSSMVHRRGR